MRVANNRLTFILALALAGTLAACDRDTPAERTEGEPVEAPAPPEPAPEPEAPAPSAPTAAERASAEIASQGLDWFYKPGWALFGPPRSEGVFTIECHGGDGAVKLLVTRAVGSDASLGETRMLDLIGDSVSLSVEVTAEETEFGPPLWSGEVADREALARVLTENARPVIVSVGENAPLALPASEKAAALARQCAA